MKIREHYDLVVAGGGIAGAALGKVMAESGAQVLIVERARSFQDRVRGELMFPWGVALTKSLGLYDVMIEHGARELRYWNTYFAEGQPPRRRDFVETTPHRLGCLNFSHIRMQEALLNLASQCGAHVLRGHKVVGVIPGEPASVQCLEDVSTPAEGQPDRPARSLSARLVVGADGRGSRLRGWAGFKLEREPKDVRMAGALVTCEGVAEDHNMMFSRPAKGQAAYLVPLGNGVYRAYFAYHADGARRKLSGSAHFVDFARACVDTGVPQEWYEGAHLIGPLAEFDATEEWVSHPHQKGVTLIGDAAATSDPMFGCGLSLALRDVATLAEELKREADWNLAADGYARRHDDYADSMRRLLGWVRRIVLEKGAEADALRARVLPHWAANPALRPDTQGLGPDAPSDEAAWRRSFEFN